jgi:hypothetical protein
MEIATWKRSLGLTTLRGHPESASKAIKSLWMCWPYESIGHEYDNDLRDPFKGSPYRVPKNFLSWECMQSVLNCVHKAESTLERRW